MSRDPVVPRLEELPEDTRRLFEVARQGAEVPTEVRSRLYASVVAPTGGGAGGSDGGVADGGVGTAPSGIGTILSGLVQSKAAIGVMGAFVGAGLVLGGQRLTQPPEDPTPAVASVPPHREPPRLADSTVVLPSASVASDFGHTAPIASSVAPTGMIAAPASAAASPEVSKDKQLRRERALIDGARMAVARRQGDAALNLLSQHAREFPRGELREEREGLMVHALALSGRKADAEDQAARYKNEFPNGLMSDSMDTALETPGPDR